MGLSINGYSIAECRVQNIVISSIIGAYELSIGLMLDIKQARDETGMAVITGCRVSVKNKAQSKTLGFARSEIPIRIEPKEGFSTQVTPCVRLTISPHQLATLESFRDGGDLNFSLHMNGEASTPHGFYPIQDDLSHHIPLSQWIQLLSQAGARNNILLEVSLPIGELTDEWAKISRLLRQAQSHFLQGDFRSVVSRCREVTEDLGYIDMHPTIGLINLYPNFLLMPGK